VTDPLSALLEKFGEEVKENPNSIIFYLEGRQLEATETIGSLGIDVATIIEAQHNYLRGSKTIGLKLQTKDRRKEKTIKVLITEKFSALMESYCQMMKLELKNLKFYFDGELLNADSTPEEMGFEDEECIDVVF
jgi:hypothetical protein